MKYSLLRKEGPLGPVVAFLYPDGRQVASYYVKTILFDWLTGEPSTGGLLLNAGTGEAVSAEDMAVVRETLRGW